MKDPVHYALENWGEAECGEDLLGYRPVKVTGHKDRTTCKKCKRSLARPFHKRFNRARGNRC